MPSKSTVDEVRERFDRDVERFSDLNAAQKTAIDSALCLDLIASSALTATPNATAVLDVGCGAGNWTLTLLRTRPNLACTLMDLSRPMLDRARDRVIATGAASVNCVQGDVREQRFDDGSFDLIVAGAVLHHLRDDAEWDTVFAKFHRWLRPGGSLWVYDMVAHESPTVQDLLWRRYGDYLGTLGNAAFVQKVFSYIEAEDTPRPLTWQVDRLRAAGFASVDILHKNGPFAAYGALKV